MIFYFHSINLTYVTIIRHTSILERNYVSLGKKIFKLALGMTHAQTTLPSIHTFCSSVIDSSRYEILYKTHPEQADLILEGKFAGMEINSYDLVNAADYVLTINSTVGFEGLLFGKKVIALGKSAYRVEDLVFTSEFTSLEQTDAFFKETSPDDLNRFLTLALKNYHLTEEEHSDPETYSRSWE